MGHIGSRALKKCQIPGVTFPKGAYRCEPCIIGKMHHTGHSRSSTDQWSKYLPGEYLFTDLQGPYTRTLGGARYSQIFLDVGSRRIWTYRLSNKTGIYQAVRSVLRDCSARSGRPVKFLQTDGDGPFRSGEFKEIMYEHKVIHIRSAAYDHEQSALIDRECRTLLEGVSTFLEQSGAPPSFWGEAAAHFTHTKNNTPTHRREEEGEEFFLSPEEILTNKRNPFSF